ncbi:MAG TPA: FAD-dependent oxidoreductase [Terriglobales bacterium]|jgi:monoamine oxidase
MDRRTALKTMAASGAFIHDAKSALPKLSSKKVIVAGAGIAGLSCAYELLKRQIDVVLLEASGRSGGHILTIHDRLADGLYADAGAEHFYRPGYDSLWKYIDELQLSVIAYPRRRNLLRAINNRLYSPEDLSRPAVLKGLGFNQREIKFLAVHSWGELPSLYYGPYLDHFPSEDRPFNANLNHLDTLTTRQFLASEGASSAAIAEIGGSESALQALWHAAIRRKRNMAWLEVNLFRIRGGNQRLTDALASRVGAKLRLNCPISAIEHSGNSVRVKYLEMGRPKTEEADYLVTCMPLATLRQVHVTPNWPAAKRYVIDNLPYNTHVRVIFQSRSRFWEKDNVSPNIYFREAGLQMVWAMAEEVRTPRGILVGDAEVTTPDVVTALFRRRYPGKSEDIEQSLVVDWTTDRWAMTCIPTTLPPGVLSKYWPEIIQPCGRIHFAGVYADNYPFGMESAVRSAHRVVRKIQAA